MKLGVLNKLFINRFTPQGAYLISDFKEREAHEVLLPTKYLQPDAQEGDEVEVIAPKGKLNYVVVSIKYS